MLLPPAAGSPDNAAVIITNAFVYYFEHCSFQGPLMAADAAAPWQPGAADRKPSLLIRADQGGPHPPLRNNWIARFSNCEWGPGAIRWEQRANDSSAVGGVFEFDTVVVEDTGAPFLELCTAPNVRNRTHPSDLTFVPIRATETFGQIKCAFSIA